MLSRLAARAPALRTSTSRRSVVVMAAKPSVIYFPIRGRAEAIRVALSLKGVQYNENEISDRTEMKENRDKFPFGQCPRYIDGDIDIVQTGTILRYIASKYNLLGANDKQNVTIDMVMEGVESIRQKYTGLIYVSQLTDDAKHKFWDAHIEKSTHTGKNAGAHLEFLARYVRSSPTGWVAGTPQPNIADCALWEMTDLLFRIWPDQLASMYPELKSYHTKFSIQPGVKEYLAGPHRRSKVNNNNLG